MKDQSGLAPRWRAAGQADLRLVARSPSEVRADIDAMPAAARAQVSAAYLAMLDAAVGQDPWVHGFNLVTADGVVGLGAFKGPPVEGVVEIAYAVVPQYQSRGYATAGVRALVEFAFASGKVKCVRAHTLPEGRASQRVLTKAGFAQVGEVIEPDDGLVWRFELTRT